MVTHDIGVCFHIGELLQEGALEIVRLFKRAEISQAYTPERCVEPYIDRNRDASVKLGVDALRLLLSHSLVIRLIDFQSISDRIGADDLLPVLLAIGAVDISAFRQYPDITGLMDSDFRKKGLPYLDDRSVSHRGIGSETVAC